MSNPEKFTPQKTYDILAEKWEYDKLKNKIEYTREEKKRFEILQKLERQIEKTGISTEKKLAELKEELTPEEETMIRKAINGDGLNTGIEEVFDERDYSLAGSVGETFSQGKKAALETIKKGGWKGILAKFSGAYKIFEEVSEKKGGILGFFAGIAAAFEFFIHGKKIEDIKELAEDKIKLVKNNIKNVILEKFPNKKEYVEKMLEKMPKEKLKIFYEKIQKGEKIKLSDLTEYFKDLKIKDYFLEKTKQVKSILFEKFNEKLHLDEEKQNKLKKLIDNYLKNDYKKIEKILDEKHMNLSQIFEILGDGTGFLFSLISEGIVSPGEVFMDFSAGGDILKISVSVLGLVENIDINSFIEKINSLDEDKKALFIGILYRKGGLFLNILGNITYGTTRLITEILPSNSGVEGLKIFTDGIFGNHLKKQIKNFGEIEKAFANTKTTISGEKILKESLENVEYIKRNFIILDVLEKNKGNFQKAKEVLVSKKLVTKELLDKASNFKELQEIVSKNMAVNLSHSGSIRNIMDKITDFGTIDAIENFNKQIEKIVKTQSRIASGKVNLSIFKKIGDAFEYSKISRAGDKLLFEVRSEKDALAFAKQLNEIAKNTPKLLRGIIDKMPIIAVTGLAATGEKTFFENLKKEIPFLLPIVGPILIVRGANPEFDWNERFRAEHMEELLLGGGLLTLDGAFAYSALKKGEFLKYMGKPIKDIFDIGKGGVEVGQKAYKLARAGEFSKIGEVFKNILPKLKNVKGPGLVKVAILLGLFGWGTIEAFDNNISDYIKDKKLDLQKIKKDIDSLSSEEKLELIKLLFVGNMGEEFVKGLDFKVNNNILQIISKNPKLQGDWFINTEIKEILFKIFNIEKINFEYKINS